MRSIEKGEANMVFRYTGGRYPVERLRRDMDRFFSGVLGNVAESGWPLAGRSRPAVNVWEDAEAVKAELELPGVKSDEVDLSVVGNELSIKVDHPDVDQEGVTYHRRERGVASFARVLRLPTDVNADRVEAEMADGVLTITLPKSEAARPRKIRVGTGK
jgi:HSP20 family protein